MKKVYFWCQTFYFYPLKSQKNLENIHPFPLGNKNLTQLFWIISFQTLLKGLNAEFQVTSLQRKHCPANYNRIIKIFDWSSSPVLISQINCVRIAGESGVWTQHGCSKRFFKMSIVNIYFLQSKSYFFLNIGQVAN